MKSRQPKTPESQRAAWRRWAAANPEKAQANRNAWAKSEAGKAWLAKNQKKKNKARDKWRAKKRAEAKKAANPVRLTLPESLNTDISYGGSGDESKQDEGRR